MKKFLLLFSIFCFTFSFAQEPRTQITGKVVVDSNELEGISVYNTSSNQGTTTNERGEFVINVALNDIIEFSALQFENFTITVDKDVIETRQITVYLVEQINKLPEVLILPYDLTGNLTTDLESVRTFNANLDALYFGINNSDDFEFADDNRSQVQNRAMHSQSEPQIVNGLNVINVVKLLISPLLSKEDRVLNTDNTLDLNQNPENLEGMYSVNFISTNFNIPPEKVDAFISYVEANGLNDRLINKDKELELLQFLYSKRDEFLAQHDKDD